MCLPEVTTLDTEAHQLVRVGPFSPPAGRMTDVAEAHRTFAHAVIVHPVWASPSGRAETQPPATAIASTTRHSIGCRDTLAPSLQQGALCNGSTTGMRVRTRHYKVSLHSAGAVAWLMAVPRPTTTSSVALEAASRPSSTAKQLQPYEIKRPSSPRHLAPSPLPPQDWL